MVVSIGRMKRRGHIQVATHFAHFGSWRVKLGVAHVEDPSYSSIVEPFLAPKLRNTSLAC